MAGLGADVSQGGEGADHLVVVVLEVLDLVEEGRVKAAPPTRSQPDVREAGASGAVGAGGGWRTKG